MFVYRPLPVRPEKRNIMKILRRLLCSIIIGYISPEVALYNQSVTAILQILQPPYKLFAHFKSHTLRNEVGFHGKKSNFLSSELREKKTSKNYSLRL